ncbi:MAG TPA: Gfo/Idh/MocA family oxidoreductase [Fimbriiglobus sp.]|jgi:predicted dehydrogenase
MVRIGLIGIGFMGRIHFLASQHLKGAKVTAVCSRDKTKLAGDWSTTRGNFGPPPGKVDLAGIKKYETLDALLADPDIDLVDICNPTHLHPEFAIAALKAGKHVLVEKAIALTEVDADAMLVAARNAGKLLVVAHVLPFFPEFKFAAEAVRNRQYGKLLGAHFTRVIAKPDWSVDIGDAEKTGGPAVDLHVHDTHFVGLLAGVPKQVFATGVVEQGVVNYLTTQYLYGLSGPCITASSGAVSMPGRPFVHGFDIYLERATLSYSSAGVPLTIFTADGQKTQPPLVGDGDPISAFTDELQSAVEGVMTGKMPDLLNGQLARDALVLCHREIESARTGRIVSV